MSIRLPEIISMGYYNTDLAVKNKTQTPPRRTTMFEIELSDCQGGVSYIDDESHRILPSLLIVGKPGQLRHTRLPYRCYFLHMIVEDETLSDMLLSLPTFSEVSDEIREITSRIFKAYESAGEGGEVLLSGLVLELIYTMHKGSVHSRISEVKKNNAEAVNKAISYVRGHLTDSLSLNCIASLVGFSPIHFHNVFKASTGLTLHTFIENERITRASRLLTTGRMSLSEIAAECGFSSQSYLNFAFKRKTGKTPREYARESNNKYTV